MYQRLVLGIFLATAVGCSSNPHKVKDVDNEIDSKGNYMGSKVGVDSNKEVVVQTDTGADQELREVRWRTYELEQKLNSSHEQLTRCRNELADPRLGGSGQVTEIPEIDQMKPTTAVKEELGLTKDGSLMVVKKEMYSDKLKAERTYEDTLRGALKTVDKNRASCDREMGYARVKHGLPAERYLTKGTYGADGTYHVTRRGEDNLDDAFRILNSEAGK